MRNAYRELEILQTATSHSSKHRSELERMIESLLESQVRASAHSLHRITHLPQEENIKTMDQLGGLGTLFRREASIEEYV